MMTESENDPLPTDDQQPSVPRANILLVDDTPANLMVLEEILGNQDYHLVKATSGRAALRCLLNDEFAVVLLDVQMPDMDGFETASLMRGNARTRNLPVIFITAKSLNPEDIERGYAQNAVDYILKPFNPEILRTKVSVFVELNRKTEALRHQTTLLTRKIQEEKQARESLNRITDQLKQSNTELEQFAYVISHDLQEPLRMVASFLQLLENRYKGKLDKTADEYIHFAVDGANRMRGMIASILHYSRLHTAGSTYEWIDCNAVLDTILSDLDLGIRESNATVTRDSLPRIWGDRTKLCQVFQNLITNAIKFRGEVPPCIHIAALGRDALPPPFKTADIAGSKFKLFSVQDNGIGFEQQYADRIFQVFQRLHGQGQYPGTGIGLAICRKIIDQHGGRIWVESEPGKGSIFYFSLWEYTSADKPDGISDLKEKP